MFKVTEEQIKQIKEWDGRHICELKEYFGEIGGRLTYCFTPTSYGTVVELKCGCGSSINLTNSEDW